MDAAAFQFAQLRIAAHSSHKLIEHLKESPAQQQDKKDNGGIQQWRKGMRLKGDMELNRDTQGNDIDQRSLRSEEHTSEPQSLMRISSAVFCLKKKTTTTTNKQERLNQT